MPAPPTTVTELLQRLCQHDTVSDALASRNASEAPLVDALESLAQAWGLRTQRLPVPNHADQLLVTPALPHEEPERSEGSSTRPLRLFDHHLDTVGTAGMTIDPFAGEVRDGRLYARGACDTKGTAAAALWALKQVHDTPQRGDPAPPATPAVLFTVDEEVAMAGVRHLTTKQLDDLPGLVESVVVGEPTRCLPIAAHAGLMRFTLTTTGVAAHSSVPALGTNAIPPMARLLVALDTSYLPTVTATHPRTGAAACSVTTLHAGQSANVIPDACVAQIDRRLAPGEDPAVVEQQLRAALDTAGDPYTLECIVQHPGFPDSHNAAWIDTVRAVLREHRLPDTPIGVPFCTHASYWAALNLPVVVLGPGDPLQAHTKDEWIALDALQQGAAVYETLMRA